MEKSHLSVNSSTGVERILKPREIDNQNVRRRERSPHSPPDFNINNMDQELELISCIECNRKFYSEDNLSRHQAEHHVERKFYCTFCSKKFKHKIQKDLHQKRCKLSNVTSTNKVQNTIKKYFPIQSGSGPSSSKNGSASNQATVPPESRLENEPVLIQSYLSKTAVKYQIQFNQNQYRDLYSKLKNNLQKFTLVLKREQRERRGLRWYVALSMNLHQAVNIKDVTSPPVVFRSEVFTTMHGDENYSTMFEVAYQQLLHQIDEFTQNGSGWSIHNFVNLDLGMINYIPLRASSYISLPKKLQGRHAVINVQNHDSKCFLWSILAALHPQENNAHRVEKYTQYENSLNFDGITFPVKIKDIPKFEKLNRIKINSAMKTVLFSPIHIFYKKGRGGK